MPKLNINIDHIATLRQARLGEEPDPVFIAFLSELAGANAIVVHLREDRRHIQDRDVYSLKKTVKTKLNLEMAPTDQMLDLAIDLKPDMVTIVPENRQELTTEGGYNVIKNKNRLTKIIKQLKSHNIVTSLFIDPDKSQIETSKEINADIVEIHTGEYANSNKDINKQKIQLQNIIESVNFAKSIDIKVAAGHGLDYSNTKDIALIDAIEELNIGYSIICRSIVTGIERAVREMVEICNIR
jgi:pyridoxine 5-phosphate synthase